jgi:hypothetical protein
VSDTPQTIMPLEEAEKALGNLAKFFELNGQANAGSAIRSALHHLEAGKEERERSEEALGWALSLIAREDPYWSNSTGYAMAERVLSVLQERMGRAPQLPAKGANESALQNLLESYEAIAVQNRCGCGHPACKNCQRDKDLDEAKAALSTTPTVEVQG